MLLKNFFLAATALLFSSFSLAQSTSYNFTGVVTSATGTYSAITVGTAVSGTYTVNYNNAQPFVSYGNPGSTTGWEAEEVSGPNVGTASSSSFVFSSTISVSTYTYTTTAGTTFSSSLIKYSTEGNYNVLEASEAQLSTSAVTGSSFSLITNGTADVDSNIVAPVPFTAGGMPAFPSGTTGTGYFVNGAGNVVTFSLTTF